jgi:hypothetical protein
MNAIIKKLGVRKSDINSHQQQQQMQLHHNPHLLGGVPVGHTFDSN